MSDAIARYHDRLREIGCVACLIQFGKPRFPVAIHHLFDPHERDDWLVAPLCEPGHHQHGAKLWTKDREEVIVPFHPGGEKKFRALYGFGEKEMLAKVIERIGAC